LRGGSPKWSITAAERIEASLMATWAPLELTEYWDRLLEMDLMSCTARFLFSSRYPSPPPS
jgi:hypothetical protein